MVNTVTRPWETRFEPIVSSIKDHVEKIRWLAEVGHMVISAKTHQMTKAVGHGQASIYQRQLLIGAEQKKHTGQVLAQVQTLSEHFENFLQMVDRSQSLLDDQAAMSTGEVHEATVGKSTTFQVHRAG